MNKLSDEILNSYLDGELDNQKRKEVEEILRNSEDDRKTFNALKLVHNHLSSIVEYLLRTHAEHAQACSK